MKSVVLYYSRSGNTKKIAKKIVESFGCDEVFIEPEQEYGNYVSSLIRFGREKNSDQPVKYKTPIQDLSKYDVIFVGFPVWGGKMPEFMQSYLSDCNLGEKTVIPFVSAGSNGRKSSLQNVHMLTQNCMDELYFYTSLISRNDVDEWLDKAKIQTCGEPVQ